MEEFKGSFIKEPLGAVALITPWNYRAPPYLLPLASGALQQQHLKHVLAFSILIPLSFQCADELRLLC